MPPETQETPATEIESVSTVPTEDVSTFVEDTATVETPVEVAEITPEVEVEIPAPFDFTALPALDLDSWEENQDKYPEELRALITPLVERCRQAEERLADVDSFYKGFLQETKPVEVPTPEQKILLELDGKDPVELSLDQVLEQFNEMRAARISAEVKYQQLTEKIEQQEQEALTQYREKLVADNKDIFENESQVEIFTDLISDEKDFSVEEALELTRNPELRKEALELRKKGVPPTNAVDVAKTLLSRTKENTPDISLVGGATGHRSADVVEDTNIVHLSRAEAREAAVSRALGKHLK